MYFPPPASQAALPHFSLQLTVLPAVYCGAQQMAEPSSSAHFVSYAVAFYIAAYGSACSFAAARGTYTEIARLQPDCNFSVMLRKMRKSGGTAGICYCYFTTDYGNNPCCLLSLY